MRPALVEDPATERDAEERRRDLLLLAALVSAAVHGGMGPAGRAA